jgi:DNA-binding CsgD family transcriptional regulator
VVRDPTTLIGRIYDASLETEAWPQLLCDMADLCGVENAALVVHDSRAEFSSVLTPRADPDVVSAYGSYWWQHDPTAAMTAGVPVGQITTLETTGRRRFLDSTFHNEYWRHSGLGAERVATNLMTDNGAFSSIVLQASRGRDVIEPDAHRAFAALVPHLVRAVSISCRLQRLEIKNTAAQLTGQSASATSSAIFIVDARMRLVHTDSAAETYLRPGSPLRLGDTTFGLADATADSDLRAAVAACAEQIRVDVAPGARIVVRHPDGRVALSIEVLPFRIRAGLMGGASPVAMLLVTDPQNTREQKIARLRDHFRLTRAEALLALEMLEGDGRAAAAARCGISVNTARTHLTRIFDKTGVNRQAELIRVILDAGGGDTGDGGV